jgi:replicative DNA helicase
MNHDLTFHAVEVEKHVIGAMFFDPGSAGDVRAILKPSDFYLEQHVAIVEAIYALEEAGKACDLVTLAEYLRATESLARAGGDAYLLEISAEVVTAVNVKEHAAIVLEKSQKRILDSFLGKTREMANSPEASSQEIIQLVDAGMLQLAGREPKDEPKLILKAMAGVFRNIEAAATGKLQGLATGFKALDYRLGGLKGGKMYVIAGIPGSGKTVLAMNIARHIAGRGVPGAIFSLEMGREDLTTRLLVAEAEVDSGLLQTGRLPQRDYPRLSLASGPISQLPLYVDDASSQTPGAIRSKMRKLIQHHGVKFMVVDYFQLMVDDAKHKSRYDDLTQVSIKMTKLCKDLNVPLIMCAQLDKESAKGGVPTLGNLKETGQLGQDATSVLLIHRPSMFKKKLKEEEDPFSPIGLGATVAGTANENIANVIAEKNRQGMGTGVDNMFFVGKFQKFTEEAPK